MTAHLPTLPAAHDRAELGKWRNLFCPMSSVLRTAVSSFAVLSLSSLSFRTDAGLATAHPRLWHLSTRPRILPPRRCGRLRIKSSTLTGEIADLMRDNPSCHKDGCPRKRVHVVLNHLTITPFADNLIFILPQTGGGSEARDVAVCTHVTKGKVITEERFVLVAACCMSLHDKHGSNPHPLQHKRERIQLI